jgi:hypothetical protein
MSLKFKYKAKEEVPAEALARVRELGAAIEHAALCEF